MAGKHKATASTRTTVPLRPSPPPTKPPTYLPPTSTTMSIPTVYPSNHDEIVCRHNLTALKGNGTALNGTANASHSLSLG